MVLRNQFKRDKSTERKSELSDQKGERIMTPAEGSHSSRRRLEPVILRPVDFFNQKVML